MAATIGQQTTKIISWHLLKVLCYSSFRNYRLLNVGPHIVLMSQRLRCNASLSVSTVNKYMIG